MAIITLNNNSLSSVTALPAAIATGKVLQVVQTVKTSISSSNHGESWSDVSGFSVNITPTNSSNKIYILVSCGTSLADQDSFAFLRLVRNSTAIALGDSRGSATIASMDASQQQAGSTNVWGKHESLNFLDSPNTTSQITYKIQSWVRAGRTLVIGGTADSGDQYRSNLPSIITVMEISA
jgi:hypothetical protein